jgi:coproporphyrinogen III oxidase-like Fe-S oxidoreductase
MPIPQSALPFEFMMNVLRLNHGVQATLFQERTGVHLTAIETKINNAIMAKLLSANRERIQASDLGYRFLNNLLTQFMD